MPRLLLATMRAIPVRECDTGRYQFKWRLPCCLEIVQMISGWTCCTEWSQNCRFRDYHLEFFSSSCNHQKPVCFCFWLIYKIAHMKILKGHWIIENQHLSYMGNDSLYLVTSIIFSKMKKWITKNVPMNRLFINSDIFELLYLSIAELRYFSVFHGIQINNLSRRKQ